jgi:outer membrane biosynthesis protein TonB
MQTQEQKLKQQRFETILWSLLIHAGLLGLLLIPVILDSLKPKPVPVQEAIWLGDNSDGLPAEGGSMPGDGNPPPPPPPPDDPLPPPPPPPTNRDKAENIMEKAEEADEKSPSEIKALVDDLKKKQDALKKKTEDKKRLDEKKRQEEKKRLDEKKQLADEKKRKDAADWKKRLADAKKTDLKNQVYGNGRSAADIAKSLKTGTGGGGTGTPGNRLGIKGGTGPGGGSTNGTADVAYDQLLLGLCKKLWNEPSLSELNNKRPVTTITITIGSNGQIINAIISTPSGVTAMDNSVRRVCDKLRDERLPPFVNFKISGTVITKELDMCIKPK